MRRGPMKYTSLLLTLSFALVPPQIYSETQEWITILIHGTIGLRPQMAFRTMLKLVRDNISNSSYKRSVEIIRDDPFFYKNQAMQELGLHAIDIEDRKPGAAASLFAKIFDNLEQERHPGNHNHYYTFGWSGLISHKMRYEESKILYSSLADELKKLAGQGIYPKIRIIGFSHGGNLALNLATIHDKEHPTDQWNVQELICVGMPVQRETDYLVCSPFFDSVYNFYSRGDHIQKLDCFSLRRFFSNRRFCNNSRYRLPEKLVQVEIKITAHGKNCCWRQRGCNELCKKHCSDRSPGHMELWFFGWPSTHSSSYRKHFPLYPLPATVFAPKLIDIITQCAPCDKHIILELRPDEELAIVRSRHHNKKKIVPLITQQKLKNLKELALEYQPEYFTIDDYLAHVNCATIIARNKRSTKSHYRKKCLCSS